VFREAMRDTVKRYALWYLIQGVLCRERVKMSGFCSTSNVRF
jgi:hypothetical protein